MLLMVCVLEPVHADIAEQLQVLYQEERKPKATLVLSHRSPQVLHSILHLVIRILQRQVHLIDSSVRNASTSYVDCRL